MLLPILVFPENQNDNKASALSASFPVPRMLMPATAAFLSAGLRHTNKAMCAVFCTVTMAHLRCGSNTAYVYTHTEYAVCIQDFRRKRQALPFALQNPIEVLITQANLLTPCI